MGWWNAQVVSRDKIRGPKWLGYAYLACEPTQRIASAIDVPLSQQFVQ